MRIHEVKKLDWSFDRDYPVCSSGTITDRMDPFPAYAHDLKLVTDTAAKVELALALSSEIDLYIYHYEGVSRTNGYAYEYVSSRNSELDEHIIVLYGKRIPIHPAMTRYLVSHEYGHHVQYELDHLRDNSVINEYQKIRGGSTDNYGGGSWHVATKELFANDFRILVTGIEKEFWPHTGFAHPHKCREIQQWWVEAVAQIEGVKQ